MRRAEQTRGTVLDSKPNDMFEVKLCDGATLICHLPNATRMRSVRVKPGDQVNVERSRFDAQRGRITGLVRD